LRTREYLTEAEVEKLMKAANGNRHGHRDATMLLVAYRHGLRAAELVDLRWDQVDFRSATLHVRRVKQGTPSAHPIIGDELRALRRLQREQEPADYWRRYLASDCQSEWAGRARRSLKFCEMQLHLVASAAPTQTDNPDRAA
jgi:integrase